jgi:hypothetical protein
VLANARSEVLVDHCRQSNAGLYYEDRWEFTEALKQLMGDSELRQAMGRNGKAYVNTHYKWSTILAKYERMFARLRSDTREPDGRRTGREEPRDGRERSPEVHTRRDRPRDGRRDRGRGARPPQRQGRPRR